MNKGEGEKKYIKFLRGKMIETQTPPQQHFASYQKVRTSFLCDVYAAWSFSCRVLAKEHYMHELHTDHPFLRVLFLFRCMSPFFLSSFFFFLSQGLCHLCIYSAATKNVNCECTIL